MNKVFTGILFTSFLANSMAVSAAVGPPNPMPEPGVWALLLAGLGAGYFLSRKKK